MNEVRYDAVLLLSFGGPEGPDDVWPFLEGIAKGRGIPVERLEKVAEQYLNFGGVSPLNEQCRRLQAGLRAELQGREVELPVWWANLNWTPFVDDVVAEMTATGHRRALVVTTSAYSSYSSCHKYLDALEGARAAVNSDAVVLDKVRQYYNHPMFVEAFADACATARDELVDSGIDAERVHLAATAHSLPVLMASGCDYERQLRQTAQLVAELSGFKHWSLAWQSRSGPPSVPWLEPDINDHLRTFEKGTAVVLAPIGFTTDNMEVIQDLDVAAAATAQDVGVQIARAVSPGTKPDPRFVTMLADLVVERIVPNAARPVVGDLPPALDVCAKDCCPAS